jgi:two-component system, LytTR family, sensor kinase
VIPVKKILHQQVFSSCIFRYFSDMDWSAISFRGSFRNKTFVYHLVGWAIFILYETLFITIILRSKSDTSIWEGYVYPYSVNICLFYFHAHITLSKSFKNTKKQYLLFILLILTELAFYLLFMNISETFNSGFQWILELSKTDTYSLLRQLWRGIYFIGFSSAYWFTIRAIRSEKKVLELEKMQIINQAEKHSLEKNIFELQNAHLQSQINPHLLFNTLNFIYNNVQEVSQEASDVVILLSELMNYSLRELEADGKVSLDKEVEQINNIIKINQIRFNNKLFLEMETNGDFSNARIIPLILIPIIENLFKHGDMSNENAPGKITINYDGEYLEMTTENHRKKRGKIISHGIGIVNVKKRLANLYNNQYTLAMNGDEHVFYVYLKIKLNTNL